MALEASLWQWLRKALKVQKDDGIGRPLYLNRVENTCMSGMPDVEGAMPSGQFWIELKSTTRPKKETTNLRFPTEGRAAQVEFLTQRWDLLCNAWILAQVSNPSGDTRNRRIFLIPGKHAADIYEGVTESELQEMSVLTEYQSTAITPWGIMFCIDGSPYY